MSDNIEKLWVLGHLVNPVTTEGDYGLLSIKSEPKVPGPPPHYHNDASELFYIINGQMDVMLDGSWRTLHAGESFTVPKGGIHTFVNNGEKTVDWITAFSPSGFEKFFTDFGIAANKENAFEQSVSDEVIKKVVDECAGYGMIIQTD